MKCSQGRLAAIAWRAAAGYGFRRDDICYCPMPLFHGNAIMALWAPAISVGATVALTRRFTASGFLADVRRHRATRFTYVGKALAYVLATPEDPADADNTLRQGFGTEASTPDRAAFEARFGCRLVEGYGSSEGGAVITVTPETPPGSLGLPAPGDDIAVCSPLTRAECPPARFDDAGRLLNADEAIGEIVNRGRAANFEGYYKNAEGDAERVHAGWYWTGDLAYRDEAGFFYFAGRGDDWLRVDSENFAAAPVERIIERHPDLAAVAVYAVADPRSGDAVMAAVELRPGTAFDPEPLRRLPGRPTRPGHQVVAPLRPRHGRPPPHRHREDHQGGVYAGAPGSVTTPSSGPPTAIARRYRLLTGGRPDPAGAGIRPATAGPPSSPSTDSLTDLPLTDVTAVSARSAPYSRR